MAELRSEEIRDAETEGTREEGITTATLANLDKQATTKRDYDYEGQGRDGEQQRADGRTGDSLRTSDSAAYPTNASARGQSSPGQPGPGQSTEDRTTPLFSPDEAKDFHARWDAIQVGFVDEPRRAVEQADSLVAGAMKRLAEGFAEERAGLEGQWDRGDSVSTEDLRVALRRYRSFFGRLLAV
jgi:hypothetical protein